MTRYMAVAKGEFQSWVVHRVAVGFTLFGTLVYTTFVYFLWKSIYRESPALNGMTFNQAFTYVALGGAIAVCFRTFTEWELSWKIGEGHVVVDLVKPLDLQWLVAARAAGYALFNLVAVGLPSALIAVLVFHAHVSLGLNCALVLVSVVLSFLIAVTIDYMIGLVGFYTQSMWGIIVTKDVVVAFLSGVLVPPAFFPERVQHVLAALPFQAIYNAPLTELTSSHLTMSDHVRLLGIQALWVVVLVGVARGFYARASRVLMVAGG